MDDMPSMSSLEKRYQLARMKQQIAELSKQKQVQNARIVEFGGVPHIHIDLKNGDIQTIDRMGQVRTTPVKVKNTIDKQSSGITYRNQPRDRRGRWIDVLSNGIKSIGKKYKKVKRNLTPKHHVKRLHNNRRQFERQHLSQQWGMPITGKPNRRRRRK